MNRYMPVGEVRVQGRDLAALASTDGTWRLEEEGKILAHGDSLDKAKAAARKKIKAQEVEVAVPFAIETRRHGLRQGIATGFRAGETRKIRVEFDGKRDEIEAGFGRPWAIWKPETPETVIAKVNELIVQKRHLENEAAQIEQEWQFDLRLAVRDAIEAAASEGEGS